MALPNIQAAQYGDRASLEKLGGVRRTNNPAADVNGMKDMVGGRPAETDPVKIALRAMQTAGQQQQAAPSEMQLSPTELEHQNEFERLADFYADTMKMVKAAQRPGAGRLTKNVAMNMVRAYSREFVRVRGVTPNFSFPQGM